MVLTSGWYPFTARLFESIKSEVGALSEVSVEILERHPMTLGDGRVHRNEEYALS